MDPKEVYRLIYKNNNVYVFISYCHDHSQLFIACIWITIYMVLNKKGF